MERVYHSGATGWEPEGSWGEKSLQAAGAWQGCNKLRRGLADGKDTQEAEWIGPRQTDWMGGRHCRERPKALA